MQRIRDDTGSFHVIDFVTFGRSHHTGNRIDHMAGESSACSGYLAFFDVGPGLQLELIQPNEASSTWRNYLNAFIYTYLPDASPYSPFCSNVIPKSSHLFTASGIFNSVDRREESEILLASPAQIALK